MPDHTEPTELTERFRETLRTAVDRQDLSRAEISRRAGFNSALVSQILGKTHHIARLEVYGALFEVLGVEVGFRQPIREKVRKI